jgi:hypothetical protein
VRPGFDQDDGRTQSAVDHARAVRCVQCSGYLLDDRDGLLG